MKTIKKKGQVPRRLPDGAAQEMVKKKGWKFCPKSEWRERVRDTKPVETKKNIKKKNERKRKTRA